MWIESWLSPKSSSQVEWKAQDFVSAAQNGNNFLPCVLFLAHLGNDLTILSTFMERKVDCSFKVANVIWTFHFRQLKSFNGCLLSAGICPRGC
jgi:hypothetical protein